MVKDNYYYQILGVKSNVTNDEIKKSYRKKAKDLHPDKGGDPEKFKELNEAYSILSDDSKRSRYDRFGKAAFENNAAESNASMNMNDIFNGGHPFFNMRRGDRMREGFNSNKQDTIIKINIDLADLYKGITKKLSIKRNILAGNPITCSMCNGSGMRVQIHQMGGMIQQIQSRCNNCNGRGISVNKVQESNVVHVEIESGSKTGDHILLKNMGDQNIDKSYNNIIIEVNENKHTVYSRKHNDLYMQYKINLAESLLGTEINFIHINGQEKFIHMPQTNVIKPYSIYRIPGEGMPIRKSNEYGDLLIKFNVVFPDSISKDDIEKLQKVFNYTPVFNTSNTSLIAFVDDTANDDFINNNDDSKNNSNEFNEEEPPGCRTS